MTKKQRSLSINDQIYEAFRAQVGHGSVSEAVERFMRSEVDIDSYTKQELEQELEQLEREEQKHESNIKEEERELEQVRQRKEIIKQRIESLEAEKQERKQVDDKEFWTETIKKIRERNTPSQRSKLIEARHNLYCNRYRNVTFSKFQDMLQEHISESDKAVEGVVPAVN